LVLSELEAYEPEAGLSGLGFIQKEKLRNLL
jgi:hypothetical protein